MRDAGDQSFWPAVGSSTPLLRHAVSPYGEGRRSGLARKLRPYDDSQVAVN